MNKYLVLFLKHIDIELGYSENTLTTYGLILNAFLSFLNSRRILLKKLNKEHIEKYIVYIKIEKGNTAKTIRLKIEIIKSFIKYLTEKMKFYKQPPITSSDFKYKIEKNDALSISEEEIDRLLNSINRKKEEIEKELKQTTGKTVMLLKQLFASQRDFVLTKLLVGTGLRISEALNIKLQDIDFIDKSIKIMGKGKRYRRIFFNLDELEQDFLEYIDEWKKLNTNHNYIFVSIKKYNQLTSRGFQLILKEFLKISKLSTAITPHTLRHTYATISIEKGANIKAVSQILGHSSCKITIDLYTHLSNSHLREVMQMCCPISKRVISIEERIKGRKKHLAYLDRTG